MAELVGLSEAVEQLVPDGAEVAMEGFTHLIPFAAAHMMIRQAKRDLTLVRMTPDVVYDQLVGAGCARKLVFSWGGNPGVGSAHRIRDAVENDHPAPLELEEHTHAGMAARYVAGASGLPFGVLRGYLGTELARHTRVATLTCPFTGEELTAVPALQPDVTIIHAQRADRAGNVALWGITGVQKEAALAASTVIVTVEEVVDHLDPPGPNAVMLPSWVVTAVAHVPRGAHPSVSMGYSTRDNHFYRRWDAVSRDRAVFDRWIDTHVRAASGFGGYLAALDDGTIFDMVGDD